MNSNKLNDNFEINDINFSNNDLSVGLNIPKKITLDLAEFLGIMVGDGHIGYYKGKSYTHYEIRITGNIKELDYHKYVNKLIQNIFSIKFNIRFQKERNAVILSKDSKALFNFLTENIGLPFGNKKDISIPKIILTADTIIKSYFLRGLIDTDFCLTFKKINYPVVQGTFSSEPLIKDISLILNELGICHCTSGTNYFDKRTKKSYQRYTIYINGHKRVQSLFSKVGFANNKYTKKLKKIKNGPEGI